MINNAHNDKYWVDSLAYQLALQLLDLDVARGLPDVEYKYMC